MAGPAGNSLYKVETVGKYVLANLEPESNVIGNANHEHNGFQHNGASYGNSVQIPLPILAKYNQGLDLPGGNYDELRLRFDVLQVGADIAHQCNVNYTTSTIQRVFDQVDNPMWMNAWAASFGKTMAGNMEVIVAQEFKNTWRCEGTWDGTNGTINPLDTYTTLSNWATNHVSFGSDRGTLKTWIPINTPDNVINQGFSQFVIERNERNFDTYKLGSWHNGEWYPTTALPTQFAGTMAASPGVPQEDLVFASINAAGDQITFTSAAAGKTINENDIIRFDATAAGPGTNLRLVQRMVKSQRSEQFVSVRATALATAAAGVIVVNITPALLPLADVSYPYDGLLSRDLAVTDVAHVAPTHRVGVMVSSNAFYCSIPPLPGTDPFDSTSVSASITGDTNISIRSTYGTTINNRDKVFIFDAIFGERIIPEYATRGLFPA